MSSCRASFFPPAGRGSMNQTGGRPNPGPACSVQGQPYPFTTSLWLGDLGTAEHSSGPRRRLPAVPNTAVSPRHPNSRPVSQLVDTVRRLRYVISLISPSPAGRLRPVQPAS